MEFNKKIYELRKQKGLTQEELAEALYVSRTAISKWEAGRGYPNIDSLKGIAKFFGVTVDELLSGDELLTVAEEDNKQKEKRTIDLVFGLLDISAIMLFIFPFFGEKISDTIQSVSLLSLTQISAYLKGIYCAIIALIGVWGVLTLTLQGSQNTLWCKIKSKASLILNVIGILIFIVSSQPYGATLLFVFLIIKGFMLIKLK